MTRLVYLPSADDDLLDIFLNIAVENERAADRMVDRIREAILRLRDYPMSAPSRVDVADDLRGLSVAGFLILHRVSTDLVEIVRIIDARRDLARLQV